MSFHYFIQLLHLPSRPGSASQDVGKNFKFSCSFFARDGRQGITECLHQPSKHKKMLGSMGMIEKKIAVMGTDEAYEMTRNKMAQADQERKGVRYSFQILLKLCVIKCSFVHCLVHCNFLFEVLASDQGTKHSFARTQVICSIDVGYVKQTMFPQSYQDT